jgi:hypothetical protein
MARDTWHVIRLRTVTPAEFVADVDRAVAARRRGDLRLFAHECRELSWAPEGLRAIGRAQLDLDAPGDARETFGWLVELRPYDGEGNRELAELRNTPAPRSRTPARTLLFTGHMVDAPDRPKPRFPPAAEPEARRMIHDAVARECAVEPGKLTGVAGGACGSDILFHEICQELGMESELYLAIPPEHFIEVSVRHGGPRWIERFFRLVETLPTRVLANTSKLPSWVSHENYSIWQRNNLWTLFSALALDAAKLTLIALWDEGPSDGPGGTEDLVRQVQSRGHEVQRLPAEALTQEQKA